MGQHLAIQLGGGVPADQPDIAVLLGAAPVGHLLQLPVQMITEAIRVLSLLAASSCVKNVDDTHHLLVVNNSNWKDLVDFCSSIVVFVDFIEFIS